MELLSLADELILEILAHLPPADVLQCRRVCRRFSFASKDRYVWTSIFSRTEYPIPDISVVNVRIDELEKILVRTEIMVKTCLEGTRHKRPHVSPVMFPKISDQTWRYAGLMGPYVVLYHTQKTNRTYAWYQKHELSTPVHECIYEVTERVEKSFLETSTICTVDDGTTYIAFIQDVGKFHPDKDSLHLEVNKFELKEGVVTLTLKQTFILWDVPLGDPWSFYNLSISSGFVILYGGNGPSGIGTRLFHISSGKTVHAPQQHSALSFHTEEPFVTSSHLITCAQDGLELLELPSLQEVIDSTSPFGVGNGPVSLLLPSQLVYECPNLIPRPSHAFVGVYIGDPLISSVPLITSGTPRVVALQIDCSTRSIHHVQSLIKLGRECRDVKCKVTPCSPFSRSALGSVTVETEDQPKPISFVIKLDFDGSENTRACRVTSNRSDMLRDAVTEGHTVELCSLDPYAGKIVYNVWETGRPVGSPNGVLILDYFPS